MNQVIDFNGFQSTYALLSDNVIKGEVTNLKADSSGPVCFQVNGFEASPGEDPIQISSSDFSEKGKNALMKLAQVEEALYLAKTLMLLQIALSESDTAPLTLIKNDLHRGGNEDVIVSYLALMPEATSQETLKAVLNIISHKSMFAPLKKIRGVYRLSENAFHAVLHVAKLAGFRPPAHGNWEQGLVDFLKEL